MSWSEKGLDFEASVKALDVKQSKKYSMHVEKGKKKKMRKRKTSNPGFVEKYFFARGYADCIANYAMDAPELSVYEYYLELTGVDVFEQYNYGYEIAHKDKVNGIV